MTQLKLFLGPGGVGKSTCSASYAIALAESGKKCAIITVDPAHRLAQILGLETLSNESKTVREYENGGKLSALWLDTNDALANVVKKYAPSPDLSEKVFNHRLFKLMEKQLGGIEDYLAVDKLIELKEKNEFDCIVVDTPPSQHAFDFLDSYKKLIDFFDDSILKYFLDDDQEQEKKKGFFSKVFKEGREKTLKLFKKTLGDNFFTELSELLSLMAPIKNHFVYVAKEFEIWIKSQDCHSFTVCSPELRPVKEARRLYFELLSRNISPQQYTFVVNRCLPFEMKEELNQLEALLNPRHFQEIHYRFEAQLESLQTLSKEPIQAHMLKKLLLFPPSTLNYDKLAQLGKSIQNT